jgi:SAM-dependent methyltransferase
MTALVSVGLLETDGERFWNGPAAAAYLVRTAPDFFGDYLRLQIDRQMYPMMTALAGVVATGEAPADKADYARWMGDPDEARLFSESQHAGSLGPGRVVARALDLVPGDEVLDVGGGTGAFAIQIAKRHPGVTCTVLDFANVVAVGREFATAAGVADRVRFVAGDALEAAWPEGPAAVVMSYLFSGVPGAAVPGLVDRAHAVMRPAGTLVVHDFMVDDDRTGPPLAALWALQHMVFTPKGRALTPGFVADTITEAGFVDVEVAPLIAGMTRLATATKAA